jgi:hypothetical protein
MKKEFVPYELAVKLKELGFDEPCLASYETAFGKGIDFELGYIIDGPKNYVLAPLYQQAFRWFREKYDLNHVITVADFGKYESGNPDFQCAIYSKNPLLITNMYKYNTYEEAELACLRKLIEIVKQNG